ncbi:hypothetical protein QQF64_018078 [Cirrhinus molitorella]|uniref:Uncharacterized protein n=2 Tax=Cirrhinus molitorella TaxID=172907 RepID=A0ABR3LKG5_9TELE|nr:hypothetical protein Q8A67_022229 [Cirrhinus molitorella]
MDLQISVFLLFVLFTAGHSLKCYECTVSCANPSETTCSSSSKHCMTTITQTQTGPLSMSATVKTCAPLCVPGTQQIGDATVTSHCCDTDLCNAADGMYKGSFLLLLSPLLFYFLFQ